MKIQRTINGAKVNIELLPDELLDAFYEQRDKFDIEDIISYGEMFGSDFEAEMGVSYNEFLSMKEEMAAEMRRNIDKYDMSFEYARSEAIHDVIARNKEFVV